jgi:hypothetical protein
LISFLFQVVASMMNKTKCVAMLLTCELLACWIATPAIAQPRARGPRPSGGGERPAPGGEEKQEIKPYDDIITKEAVSKPGLFLTHQVGDKLYYEIAPPRFGKDMLWVTQIEQTQAGFSYAGMPVGDRVVRWELRDEQVLLRDVKYAIRADVKDSVQMAVEATSITPIIKTFPVKAWGKDKSAVIEVTSLFTSDVPEFSPQRELNASGIDTGRSFLEEIKAFPNNIETKVLATFRLGGGGSSEATPRPPRDGARRDPTQSAVTVLLHHSMMILPESPMTPRVYDERVGFFAVGFEDYGDIENHQVETTRFITRWRLEKQDPSAAVSEPKQPIVFYVGREVPDKWKEYVRKGIESWQPAFEKAGFKNAIIGKLAPGIHEDPNWDAEDARISSIRWLPSTTENAFGPHVHDPRSGEILEADVRIYHNVMKLARDWYFVQASPNDERAQKLPLPDELMGELLAYIVAHEVGHSLGFPHNMKASAAYTVENLRSADFTKLNGVEASIMDYGRYNYVAQPGDGAALIPIVAPYDYFAVDWGYRQYASKEEEEKGLTELVAKQKTDPILRFGDADPSEDPTRQTEDLGRDSIEATRLGLANIDRVAGYLVAASCKPNKDYSLLRNMYDQLLAQRNRELVHVTAMVGGFEQINLFFGDADQVYHPVPVERQREAVAFLVQQAFQTPTKLVDPQITARLEASGAAERILGSQQSILRSLVNDGRLRRMAEYAQRTGGDAATVYTPAQLLADLTQGIWTELDAEKPRIDLYRRNLQRAYVELLTAQVNAHAENSDLPGLARVELQTLRSKIEAKNKDLDLLTKAHLDQVTAMINATFDTRVMQVQAAPAAPAFPRRGDGE